MPRRGATGDAGGGRQGAKYRSTNQQLRMPREWARSSSAFNFRVAAFDVRGFKSSKKKPQVTSHRSPYFYVQPTAVSAGPPPVVRHLFEVNSEPHTGARPSVRLCVGLITEIPRKKYCRWKGGGPRSAQGQCALSQQAFCHTSSPDRAAGGPRRGPAFA
jgi:hypothetical protein